MNEPKKKILITPQGIVLAEKHIKRFFRNNISYIKTNGIVSNRKRLIKQLSNASGCIIGSEIIDKNILQHCKKLKVICRFGSGLDNIDIISAKKMGIKVFNVKAKSVPKSVAIHTISLILSITQNIKKHIDDSRRGKWIRHLNMPTDETIVGSVGSGAIGSEVIKLSLSLGFKVYYTSKTRKKNLDEIGAKFVQSLSELIKKSDIVTLHLPKINSKFLISKTIIKNLKNKSLINVSRGSLVDEEAILDALNKKYLNFYATDVTEFEPPRKYSKILRKNENVISTAHVGGYNMTSLIEVSKEALKKVNNAV